MWSRCVLGVLSSSESGGQWAASGEALLSHSYITLGEWKDRIQQLQDLSAVLWDNMGMPSLAEFRYSKALSTQPHCLYLNSCKIVFGIKCVIKIFRAWNEAFYAKSIIFSIYK